MELFLTLIVLGKLKRCLIFIIENRDDYTCNYDIRKRNARQGTNLRQSKVSLSLYQKCLISVGIKTFNNLPSCIKGSRYTIKI
jgi:hypothetical protein